MGAGGGSRGGQGCRLIQTDSTPTVEPATTSVSAALKAALLQEYANQAYYKEVLDKFGSLRRFENLHAAEGRHAEAVLSLMARYGVEPAKAEEADVPEVPATLAEAIQVAIHNEEVDVALYDGLLGSDLPEDVKAVFQQLRTVSAENHLRALRRGAAGGQERGGQGFRGGRRS